MSSTNTGEESEYTSSEEEFIQTKKYVMKSGRTSRTRYRKEFLHNNSDSDNLESSSSSDS